MIMSQTIRNHGLAPQGKATQGKKWLVVTLAAAALTLSACGKKDEPMAGEPDNTAQSSAAQPSVEQAQAGTDVGEATNAPVMDDNVATASADNNNGMGADNGMATADGANDDVATASADDSNMMDGTESEEHISTN